jgi:hypothetical protein
MKKPEPLEGFSCVEMQRHIREQLSQEIKKNPKDFFKKLRQEFAHIPKANRSSSPALSN